jgi:hypothetical protein
MVWQSGPSVPLRDLIDDEVLPVRLRMTCRRSVETEAGVGLPA